MNPLRPIIILGATELARQIYLELGAAKPAQGRVEWVEHIADFNLEECPVEPDALILAGNEVEENLALALDALDRWQATRLVLRFFNRALGEELEKLSPRVCVLSASEISAPLFAASALEAGVRRAWRDEQAGILVEHEGDSRAAVSRVLGSHEDAAEVRVTFFRSMREFLRDPWVLRVLSGILVLVLLASAYFGMAMGLSPVDALYFVVSTVTTTGYGDISPRSFGVGAEVAAMFVMLGGTTLSAVLFALISDRLFTLRIDTALGHWPIPRRNHVVVVGVGDVGVRVCEAFLDLDTPIVAIEKDSNGRFVAQMRGRRVPLVLADATVSSTLEFAQVKHARAVVCVTDHDLVNVEVALNARRLNPAVRTVVRIQEPDFAARLGNRLGVDVALSSARIAAPVFVRSALERGNG